MNDKIMMAIIAILMAVSAPAVADPSSGDYGYHPMMGWGGWFMGPLMMLLFVAFLVGAAILVARMLGWQPGSSLGRPDDRSLAILRERFARGEIDQQEFDARRKALE